MKNSIYYGLLFIFLWVSLARALVANQQNGLEKRHWDVKEDCYTTTTSHRPKTKTIADLPTATATTFHRDKAKNDSCKKDKNGSCCDKKEDEPQFEPQVIAAGVILIVFAVYLLVAGFLFFRITMIVTGLLLGCKVYRKPNLSTVTYSIVYDI
jgi:hypothetical protein